MVKSYLKYELHNSFGSLCSPYCGSVANYGTHNIVTATDDSITIWDTRTFSKVANLTRNSASKYIHFATVLLSNGIDAIYAGYSDGSVCIWNQCILSVTFHGHKGKISCLAVSSDYTLLASGGNDTDILVWDLVSNCGISRLRGHLNQVTSIIFTSSANPLVVSGSKDGVIRIWDHAANVCLQALIDCPDEIWSLALSQTLTELYVGTKTLRLYQFDPNGSLDEQHSYAKFRASPNLSSSCAGANFIYKEMKVCSFGHKEFLFDDLADGGILIASGNSKFVLFYRLYAVDDQEKRAKKRAKRNLQKLAVKCKTMRDLVLSSSLVDKIPHFDNVVDEYDYLENLLSNKTAMDTAKDETDETNNIAFLFALNVNTRVRAIQVARDYYLDKNSIKLIVAHTNNSISFWEIPLKKLLEHDFSSHNLHSKISNYHSKPINTLCMSTDDTLILTISPSEIKLWDVATSLCIKTFDVVEGTSGFVVPGNDAIFYGTKDGELCVINVNTCETHSISRGDEISRLVLSPQMDSFILARATGAIETYNITLNQSIGCEITSSFTSSDKPTDIVISRNQSLIAIGQLDGTILTYHSDSKKLNLTLYGHKLPIHSIDLTSDSTLLASSAADKTLKIWGLDFGNIHKSFTFTSIICCVKWIPLTHYTMSVDENGVLYMHDADNFQQVFFTQVHCYPALKIAMNSDGSFFATCGKDCTIKLWNITDKQLFVQEEMEIDMELDAVREDIPQAIQADENVVAYKVTRQNIETVKSSEHLIQVLDEASNGTANLFGITGHKHVIGSLVKLDSNNVYDLVITLPFSYATKLLEYLAETLEIIARADLSGLYNTEIICHTALTIAQVYFRQLAVSKKHRVVIKSLKKSITKILRDQESLIEFNNAFVNIYTPNLHSD